LESFKILEKDENHLDYGECSHRMVRGYEKLTQKLMLHGRWFRQFKIIISFYFFDYLSTIYHCKNPLDEWSPVAKCLMIFFNNITFGMTVFFWDCL